MYGLFAPWASLIAQLAKNPMIGLHNAMIGDHS